MLFLTCLAGAGCGLEEYERRLKATEDYYAYQERLDRNLSPVWKTPPIEALRVPLQFTEIPPPQPVEGPDGQLEAPPEDSRQPDYADFRIPGLIGAWRADVDVLGGENRDQKPVYLYVATNHQLLLGDKTEALNFLENLLTAMEADFQTTKAPQGTATFPKGHQFSPRQEFENYTITGDAAIHDTRYVSDVYTIKQTENHVAIILVRPEGMDPMSKIHDRLQLSLETLRVSAAAPQPQQAGPGGPQPSGPAPAQGSF